MAYRPTWQGHLKLSLVTCPVSLYTAVSPAGDVHFNLINPKTNNRIKMVTTDPDSGLVNRSDLVKGYEVSKGEYILLTDEEIKSVKLESTKTIDIERFVPEGGYRLVDFAIPERRRAETPEYKDSIDDDPEMRVIVREVETGHERCFTVDLDTGDTSACG